MDLWILVKEHCFLFTEHWRYTVHGLLSPKAYLIINVLLDCLFTCSYSNAINTCKSDSLVSLTSCVISNMSPSLLSNIHLLLEHPSPFYISHPSHHSQPHFSSPSHNPKLHRGVPLTLLSGASRSVHVSVCLREVCVYSSCCLIKGSVMTASLWGVARIWLDSVKMISDCLS